MKNLSAFMTLALLVCLVLSACSVNRTESQNQTTVQETTAPAETSATATQKPTEKPTENPTEAPTQKPTEDVSKKANAAYLEYIESHPEWFVDYNKDNYGSVFESGKPFALYDINGDNIDELFYVHPNTEENGKLNLGIVTYDGEVKELYDDILVNLPGSESEYFIFVGEDDKLYNVMRKELWGHVIKFDMDGDNFSTETLAESDSHHLAKPEEAKCTKDGEPVSYDEFDAFLSSVKAGAKKYILLSYNRTTELENLSMSYDEVIEYLNNNS